MTDRPQIDTTQDNSPGTSMAPTVTQLKADIDSGRTGDKVPTADPGLSPLGTDDEAAGRPPSAMRVALARYHETRQRWSQGGRRKSSAHQDEPWIMPAYIGLTALVGVVLAVGIWRVV